MARDRPAHQLLASMGQTRSFLSSAIPKIKADVASSLSLLPTPFTETRGVYDALPLNSPEVTATPTTRRFSMMESLKFPDPEQPSPG